MRLDRQEETSNKLRNENSNLNHDLNQLVNVISTARTTGTWSVSAAYNMEKKLNTVKILNFRTPKTFVVTTLKVEQEDLSLE